jgi:hypothetical protein
VPGKALGRTGTRFVAREENLQHHRGPREAKLTAKLDKSTNIHGLSTSKEATYIGSGLFRAN